MAALAASFEPRQVDFLYWHAVSKMRMADFEGAGTLFRLLHVACPDRTDVALGRVYCLVRLAEFDAAAGIVTLLRRRPLRTEEMALLGRLQRRCEFERARDTARVRALNRAGFTSDDPAATLHPPVEDALAYRSADRS